MSIDDLVIRWELRLEVMKGNRYGNWTMPHHDRVFLDNRISQLSECLKELKEIQSSEGKVKE